MNHLKKNIVYQIVYQILLIILPLITTPYVSRVIGVEGLGIYSYSLSVVNYFILFSMLGLNNYGSRTIAQVRNDKKKLNKTFWEIYLMQCITTLIIIVFYIIFIIYSNSLNKYIFLIQGLSVVATLLDINWFFFGLEKFKLTVLRNTFIKFSSLILILLLVKKEEDLWKYTLIISGGTFLTQSILWLYLPKYIHWEKINLKDVRKHLKANIVLFIPLLGISIFNGMDKIMLGNMTSLSEVGLYENSERITQVAKNIISGLGVVMLPTMSNLVAQGKKEDIEGYIQKSMTGVLFFSIAIMFGLVGIVSEFVPIFFGEKFLKCEIIITILAPTIVIISWANVIRTQYLIPNSCDKEYIIAIFVGALINLIVNLFLIKPLGAVGASIGTVMAEIGVATTQAILVRNKLQVLNYLKSGIYFIFSGFIMYIGINILPNVLNNILALLLSKIILGAIIYLFLCLIYFKRKGYFKDYSTLKFKKTI